ncbi:IS1 family transposase [Methylocaldum szegediense]|uniref:Transposase n=1 Tax=Methylocaldum szegediense TaxID=73780 RepID=A0ABM9I8Y5_9GAMM|nr:protein of unknown function [Methylocaldum szegediense]
MLECDKAFSYVGRKATPMWLWIAFSSHARRIVAYALGDRTETTARQGGIEFRPAIVRPRFTPLAGNPIVLRLL